MSWHSGKFLDTLESFWIPWKISGLLNVFGHSGMFPDSLQCFRTPWKVFRRSGKFPKHMKFFRTLWNVSGYIIFVDTEKFLEPLEIPSTFLKASRLSYKFHVNSRIFLVTVESLRTFWKTFRTLTRHIGRLLCISWCYICIFIFLWFHLWLQYLHMIATV